MNLKTIRYFLWAYKNWILGFFLSSIVFCCMAVLSYEWTCSVVVLDAEVTERTAINVARALVYYAMFLMGCIIFIALTRVYGFIHPHSVNFLVHKKSKELFRLNQELKEGLIERQHLIEWAKIGIALVQDKEIIYTNPMLSELLGYSSAEMNGMPMSELLIEPESFPWDSLTDLKLRSTLEYKLELKKKRGDILFSRLRVTLISKQKKEYLFLIDDESYSKQKDEFVRDYTALFSVLSYLRGFNQKNDENFLIKQVLNSILKVYGFSMGFYGKARGKKIYLDVITGSPKDVIPRIKFLNLDDPDDAESAMVKVFQLQKPVGYGDTFKIPYYRKYWYPLDEKAFSSTYAFPMVINGVVEGVISFFSSEKYDFNNTRPERLGNLIVELCKNIEEQRTRSLTQTAIRNYEERLRSQIQELEKNKQIMEQQAADMNIMIGDLITARDAAEEANRSKTEFLANVSHELRTPLNAILGFSETMQMKTFGNIGNPQYEDYINYIHSSGIHLLSLINDILDLSRVESGQQKLTEKQLTVRPILDDVMGIVSRYPKAENRHISLFVDDRISEIKADERAFKQIMLNLLSNAVKFTHDDGHIEVSVTLNPKKEICIAVQDDGIGVPAEKISKLFTPFTQVENIFTRVHSGSGLGLSLVKRLVELHDGHVKMDSIEGKGTTVTVYLPKERLVETEQKEGKTTPKAVRGSRKKVATKTAKTTTKTRAKKGKKNA